MTYKGKREIDKILPIEEYRKMLSIAGGTNSRDFALLWLTGMIGGRLSEMVELRRDHIDLERNTVTRVLNKREQKAGEESRELYLSRAMMDPVRAYVQKQKAYVFPSQDGRTFMHWRTAQECFGFYHKATKCKERHTFHSLRHLHGSLAYEATEDLVYTKWRLGHIVTSVEELYVLSAHARRDQRIVEQSLEPLLYKYGILLLHAADHNVVHALVSRAFPGGNKS